MTDRSLFGTILAGTWSPPWLAVLRVEEMDPGFPTPSELSDGGHDSVLLEPGSSGSCRLSVQPTALQMLIGRACRDKRDVTIVSWLNASRPIGFRVSLAGVSIMICPGKKLG
jgi:hypothetical protein